jgi:dihydrofolate synthase/folylpolyglutamate synthase
MVEAMARAGGARTGLYTSPHLCRFAERIRVDGEPIGDDALAAVLADVLDREPDLSFFEAATLAALVALREARVEVAVLEVGLGGRLDATNVVEHPLVGAVTRIALDHTDRLGTTVESIAREKAGIAKPGLELVLGPVSDEVRRAIDDVARRAGARTTLAAEETEGIEVASPALAGAHQQDNARVAWVLADRIGVPVAARRAGLTNVRWPGRLERIAAADGAVLLDAAHNPDGARALSRELARERRTVALVFGALADKAWPEMIDVLAPHAASRVYVEVKGRAATDPHAIAARAPGLVERTFAEAYARARAAAGPSGLVVVTGSILLAGEARAYLLGLPRDPPVAL